MPVGDSNQGQPVQLVDVWAALTPDDLAEDGVHPNRTGLDKIAGAWVPVVRDIVNRQRDKTDKDTR